MTMTTSRAAALRQVLLDRRREVQGTVAGRVREGRAPRSRDVGDALDTSDADVQNGMDFMLLQMKATTLTRIDEALGRLSGGQYGSCVECETDIPERRLRALPFAVRCQACEARREAERGSREHDVVAPRWQPDFY
jgi:DnaK suppressor protein